MNSNLSSNLVRGAALSLCLMAPWSFAAEPAQEAAAEQARAQAGQEREKAERDLADAQRRLEEAAKQVAELSSKLGNEASRRLVYINTGGPGPRALLGVQVDSAANQSGAMVTAVSPGGAAETAGIKVGDVITAIGGAELPAGADASSRAGGPHAAAGAGPEGEGCGAEGWQETGVRSDPEGRARHGEGRAARQGSGRPGGPDARSGDSPLRVPWSARRLR